MILALSLALPGLWGCAGPASPVPVEGSSEEPPEDPVPAASPPPSVDDTPAQASAFGMRGVDYACAVCGEARVQMGIDLQATASSTLDGYPSKNANNRVKTVRVTTGAGASSVVTFSDPTVAIESDLSTGQTVDGDWFDHVVGAEPPWHVLPEPTDPSDWVALEILAVYPGSKYTDTCVSRLDVMTIDPDEL